MSDQHKFTIERKRAPWTEARHRSFIEKKAQALADKAQAEHQADQDAAPLFADQLEEPAPTPTFNDLYWQWRFGKARSAEGLCGYGVDADLMWKDWCVYIMQRWARQLMDPQTFEWLRERRWTGDLVSFWRDVLTGRRQVVAHYDRVSHGWRPCDRKDWTVCCEHGCSRCEPGLIMYLEQVTITPHYWPAEGWQAPLTVEQLDSILTMPAAEAGPNEDEGLQLLAQLGQALAVRRTAPGTS